MKTKKFTITAVGTNRLDVLNRISVLYLQRQIPVESFFYENTSANTGKYKIVCSSEHEETIKRIVTQMNNIIEISQAQYTCK